MEFPLIIAWLGESVQLSQHKMTHLLHQETKFCLKKSNENQTQHLPQNTSVPKS